jgi:hypothetical protein
VSALSKFLPQIKLRSALRLEKNNEYNDLLKSLDEFKERSDQKLISLQEDKRRRERTKESDADDDNRTVNTIQDSTGQKIQKDLLIVESSHILGDYILLTKKKDGRLGVN